MNVKVVLNRIWVLFKPKVRFPAKTKYRSMVSILYDELEEEKLKL